MKHTLVIILLSLFALTVGAQMPNEVWDKPLMGFNSHSHVFSVKKVALGDDRTEVTFHVTFRPDHWIKMASSTYLQVGEERFAMQKTMPLWAPVGTTLIEPDQQFFMPKSGEVDFTLVFAPLPKGTKHFDLIEPAGWQIFNVRPKGLLPEGITDTYWRNDATGDWLIGFAEHYVVYDSRMWEIRSREEKKGGYTLLAVHGDEPLNIRVEKMKKGVRKISINDSKAVVCSPIVTPHLPDYPTRDLRTDFKDNAYQAGDSATIVGWIKDLPPTIKQKQGYFSVFLENVVSDKQEVFNAPFDTLGRFSIKVPLLNTSSVYYMDQRHGGVVGHIVLEPGETYFYLYDGKTGQTLFMGKNARLQNELLAYQLFADFSSLQKDHSTAAEAMAFLEENKRRLEMANETLDSILLAHPNLSQRFVNYQRSGYIVDMGRELMQARFYVDQWKLPKEYVDYVSQNLWLQHGKPYTLHREFSTFMRDYIDVQNGEREGFKTSVIPMIKEMAKQREITISDKELEVLNSFAKSSEKLGEDLSATDDAAKKQALIDAFNSSELIQEINNIVGKLRYELSTKMLCEKLKHGLDSVASDRVLYELYIARELYKNIDDNRRAMPDFLIEWMNDKLKIASFRQQVLAQHEKYEALSRRDISNSKSLRSPEDVAGMSDGEKILRRLIEPYKGKLVLIDVWGTWCSPCKRALADSQEEYARLEPYNMVFLYLANHSDNETWQNVIKENNVLGENVVHYNLPAEQQHAVEQFLKVTKFPSYFLIDRQGQLLDVNADPRNLDSFEQLIKSL